ncbi:lantibiotic dehydratase [Nonomuraea sp. NBC_01738]|uniref:lantibiotic dehydratase n=1 Tax=Nonomuraea sp. NBC_01738 TaxID=2976003 RepID=UPI002E0E3B1C|nr:lantibiotic dehydratase [Nonomuraea sp. NBC_01738]
MSRWLNVLHPRPHARALLFCLPYAGSGAVAFHGWAAAADPGLEVLSVVPPGRESRITEPVGFDVAELATVIAGRADRPYALYGHSMGGRAAFELVRELRRRGERLPERLYLGGCCPPDRVNPLDGLSQAPDDELLRRVSALGGMPQEVLDSPELVELVLPILRGDFAWLDAYRYRAEEPLPVPITAFGGADDPVTEAMPYWREHTSAAFELHVEPGGHFFLRESMERILGVVAEDLLDRPHLMPLGRTGWSVWREAIVRSTGFPAAGLELFAAPDLARAADEYLDAGGDAFDPLFDKAIAESETRAIELAADPLLREAVIWQNRSMLPSLDGLAKPGPRNRRRRARELMLAKYWQRYCAKNETIGFFGPVTWTRVDADGPAVTVEPGPGLVRERRVGFEDWAIRAYAARLAADPAIRPHLPVAVQPHLALEGRELHRPAQAPIALSAAEAAVLAWCDGRRTASEVAGAVSGQAGIRTAADAMALLERLAERGLLSWGELPQVPDTEVRLRRLLTSAGADQALAGLDRLCAARDRVAAAAGDPEALHRALDAMDAEFTEVTGLPAQRKAGQTYAGRGLVYEDTTRDVTVSFGAPVLDAMAEPLALLLRAARWLTAELAAAYGSALRELYAELRDTDERVRLADLWFLAQGALFGSGPRPVDAVAEEFAARWTKLFGLTEEPVAELRFTAADLAEAAGEAFPATLPGWSTARLHSPDLQICAESAEAIGKGDFLIVLGELHAAWPTFNCAVFTRAHPDPGRLRDAMVTDLGPDRVHPLPPEGWPRFTGRLAATLDGPTDRQLGWTAAPGADPGTLLPAASVLVGEQDGELVARWPDGTARPLLEMFAGLMSMHAVDGFKLTAAHGHTPRLTIDRLVVARETWRTTAGESGLGEIRGEREAYLAVRAWRRRLGLPERVFVKLSTEIKPTYADLGSPLYAALLCAMVRRAGDPGTRLVITEMLPGPEQAWLADAEGRRYFTELRLHTTDPLGMS